MKKTNFVYLLLPFILPATIAAKNELTADEHELALELENLEYKALEHEDLEQKLIDSHAKIVQLKNVQFYIPDQTPVEEINSIIFSNSKDVISLSEKSKNFQQLIYCIENVLFNKNYEKKLLDLFFLLKTKNKIKINLNNFKNIKSLKHFKNELKRTLRKKNRIMIRILYDMKKAQLKFVNEAINAGILHILYAKEFCGRANKFDEESYPFLQGFCKIYVDNIADPILNFCGIKFEATNEKAVVKYNP